MEWKTLARSSASCERHFEFFVKGLSSCAFNSVQDIKKRNQLIGRVWEEFCKEVLLLRGYDEVLLLEEASEELLDRVGLGRRDVGIDLLARRGDEGWTAVQCKFRGRGIITWQQISTFAALCARSGPFIRHLVMTNANYVKREGRGHFKDATMAKSTFTSLQRHEWLLLAGAGEGNTCGGSMSAHDAKEAFLNRFSHA